MLKRFDANHDGKLDESERAAARQAWQQRMAGSRGPEHQAGPAGGCQCCRPPMRGMQALLQAHPGMRAKLFERFDADHDGKLSDTERAAARQAVQERFKQAGPHRQEVMARFDANQDGTLNETERASARSAWQEFLKQHPVIKPTVPATGT